MGPPPALARVRVALRASLADLAPGAVVLAACSGGSDSLALAAGLAHVAPRLALRAGGVTVDHGLQPGSADRARAVAAVLARLGLDPVENVFVTVPPPSGRGGPEAAARAVRYEALEQAAGRTGADVVLLGHSRDDQAEAVLLGLARGSGTRSLAGMPERRGCYRRPLLGLSRATLRSACDAQGLRPWEDPHNIDPAYARARVRHRVLPALEEALGPGVADALARTAEQLRQDAEVLEGMADIEARRICDGDGAWDASLLASLHPALRRRVLRTAAVTAGCPAGALGARHIAALEALVVNWHGQRGADLPGGVRGIRRYGKLLFTVGHRAGRGGRTDAEGAVGRD